MGLKKWTRGLRGQPGQALTVQVLCLGLLFTLGMVGGYLYAASCGERSQLALAEYLSGFCDLYQEGAVRTVSLFTAARLYFTEFLAAFLLGLVPVGIFLLPVLSGAYGFLTMFAVACFSQVYGRAGALLALALFGPRALFTVPCFLWVAAGAWARASSRLTGRRGKRCAPVVYDGAYFYRLCVCVVWLMLGVCVERYVTPSLFQWALGALGG